MIPDMRRLLERIQKEREEFAASPVMRVHECQGAINTACINTFLKMLFYNHVLRRFDRRKEARSDDNLLIL
jgi:hypothetical protein